MEDIIRILTPAIAAHVLSSEQRKAFERGLDILDACPNAASFVKECRRFRDYHRRVRLLLTYLQSVPVTDAPAKRHVGRPSLKEQRAYAEAQKAKALDEVRRGLFPDVKPDFSLQPLTYGGIVANPNGESIAASMPNLIQLRPFLSPSLQEQVNNVRALRNEMASKAEQAKTMAEANEKCAERGNTSALYGEAEIAALASRAVKIESDILPKIYLAVDREIGEVYLRLSPKTGDPEYISNVEKFCNVPTQNLRTMFRPFYEKAMQRDEHFADWVAERIAADRPEVKAERDCKAKHKAEADAVIKYIMRKDKPATMARLKGIESRIALLRESYSDIVSEDELLGFEAVLLNTKAEFVNREQKKLN